MCLLEESVCLSLNREDVHRTLIALPDIYVKKLRANVSHPLTVVMAPLQKICLLKMIRETRTGQIRMPKAGKRIKVVFLRMTFLKTLMKSRGRFPSIATEIPAALLDIIVKTAPA